MTRILSLEPEKKTVLLLNLDLLVVLLPRFCKRSMRTIDDADDEEVGLKEKPEVTRYIKRLHRNEKLGVNGRRSLMAN